MLVFSTALNLHWKRAAVLTGVAVQDFGRGTYRKEPTFEVDDEIIAASKRMAYA